MGFAVASKGAPLAGLLKKFLLAAPAASSLRHGSVAGACRLFNTRAPPHRGDDDSKSRVEDFVVYDRRGSSNPQAFGLYPSVEQRCCWVSNEDDDATELKVGMLGLEKEQVKVQACEDTLLVKWEGVKGSDGEVDGVKGSDGGEDPAWCSRRINLSVYDFKVDQAKAEMKGGILTITVPKIKDKVEPECIDIRVE